MEAFYGRSLGSGSLITNLVLISSLLVLTPNAPKRSFLYTETDDNDLTYFLLAQTEVIARSICELRRYIERKAAQLRHVLRRIPVESHEAAVD